MSSHKFVVPPPCIANPCLEMARTAAVEAKRRLGFTGEGKEEI